MDSPKCCTNTDSSSDKGDPDADSLLQSVPSIPRRTSSSTLSPRADDESEQGSKARPTRKTAEADSLGEDKPIGGHFDEVKKSQGDSELSTTYTDCHEQERSKGEPCIDNKLLEELNSLRLQIQSLGAINALSLHGSAEMGEYINILMGSESEEVGPEVEKQENELPEKGEVKDWRNEHNMSMKMMGTCQKGQKGHKWNILKMVQGLSQQKRLTNRMLTRIYSCYREQAPATLQEKEPDPKELKNFFISLSDRGSLLWDSLKEALQHSMAKRDVEGTQQTADPSMEHHLSELSVEDLPPYPYRLSMEPVENSCYSFTPGYGNTAHSTRLAESLSSVQNLKAILRSVYSVLVSGFENRADMETQLDLKDEEVLNQLHDDEVEKGEAEIGDQKKDMVQENTNGTGTLDPAKLDNYTEMDVEKDTDNVAETDIFEKSEFEELEKTKEKGSAATKPAPPPPAAMPLIAENMGPTGEWMLATRARQDTGQSSTRRKTIKTKKKPQKKEKRQPQQPAQAKNIEQNKNRSGHGHLLSASSLSREGSVEVTVGQAGKLHPLAAASSPPGGGRFEIDSTEQAAARVPAARGPVKPSAALLPLPEGSDQEELHWDAMQVNMATVDGRHVKNCTCSMRDPLNKATGELPLEITPEFVVEAEPMKKGGKANLAIGKERSGLLKKKASGKKMNSPAVAAPVSVAQAEEKAHHSVLPYSWRPQPLPRFEEEKNHLPGAPARLDVRRAVIVAVTTSGGTKGGSGSSGQGGGHSANSNSQVSIDSVHVRFLRKN